MLDDQHAVAERRGQRRDQLGERPRAAGRAGDHDGAACRRRPRRRRCGRGRRRGAAARRAGAAAARGRRREAAARRTLSSQLGEEVGRGARRHRAWRRARPRPRPARRPRGRRGRARRPRRPPPGRRGRVAQRAQHADAVQAGHRQVERQHVGPRSRADGERLVAVGGDADDLDAALASAPSASIRRMKAGVVGDDDADRACGEVGAGVHGGEVPGRRAAGNRRRAGRSLRGAGQAAISTPANRPSGFSRIASRSPTLAIAST